MRLKGGSITKVNVLYNCFLVNGTIMITTVIEKAPKSTPLVVPQPPTLVAEETCVMAVTTEEETLAPL